MRLWVLNCNLGKYKTVRLGTLYNWTGNFCRIVGSVLWVKFTWRWHFLPIGKDTYTEKKHSCVYILLDF